MKTIQKYIKKITFFCITAGLLLSCSHTTEKTYYSDGQLRTETQYKDSVKDGYHKAYYPDGTLLIDAEYKDGLKHGWYRKYYPNGQLHWEIKCKNDEENGWYRKYSEDGKIISESLYKNGKQHGITKVYYDNGKLKTIAEYRNNIQHGPAKFYSPTGQLELYSISKNDTTIFYKEFNEKGELIEEFRFVSIIPESDTLNLSQTYHAKIDLTGPEPDTVDMRYVVRNIHDLDADRESGKLPSETGEAEFTFTPKTTGVYSLEVCIKIGETISKELPNIFNGQRYFWVIEKPES